MRKFENLDVEDKFMTFPEDKRNYLFHLRELIFDAAEADTRIGPLTEELRWGDPSYITASTNSGSTIRLGLFGPAHVALFFHCKTTLVESFKEHYANALEYSKNRAVLISPQLPPEDVILRKCIHASLVYKLRPLKNKTS